MSDVVDFGKAKAAVESDGWSEAANIVCECGCLSFELIRRAGAEENEPLTVVCANCNEEVEEIPPATVKDVIMFPNMETFRTIYGSEELDVNALARNRAAKMLQEGEAAIFAHTSIITGSTTFIAPHFETEEQLNWALKKFTDMIELAKDDLGRRYEKGEH